MDAQMLEYRQQVFSEITERFHLTPKRVRKKFKPVPGAKVTIIEGESKHGKGIKGKEKWRECPFGEMEIGDSFIIPGKKTMVASRLFIWALHYDFKRERKFQIDELKGLVTCTRTE